jgi:2-hydroxychromene-2-carboxylate isomerase
MNAERQVRFLFDFVSPYSYLAWTQIHAVAARHGRDVVSVPILFAALLDANGQKGPAEIPSKRAYLFKDCVRIAHTFGVPFALPPSHPFNPLLALRVASVPLETEARRALVDRLYRAAWGDGTGVTEAAVVERLAREAGLDGARLLEDAQSAEGKARVKRQTDEALAASVFGVPTAIADGEVFWGTDSLPHLERFLRGEDPVDAAWRERVAKMPRSAERPRSRA